MLGVITRHCHTLEAQNPAHLRTLLLSQVPGTRIQALLHVEEGDLGFWRGAGAGSLVRDARGGRRGRWVFMAWVGLVGAQGDGVVQIIVLWLETVGA